MGSAGFQEANAWVEQEKTGMGTGTRSSVLLVPTPHLVQVTLAGHFCQTLATARQNRETGSGSYVTTSQTKPGL